MFKFTLLLFFICGLTKNAFSANVALNSSCSANGEGEGMAGYNHNQAYPIASLTKILTANWLLHSVNPMYRFKTQIYITPSSEDAYDVHLAGSLDPFWGRSRIHLLISELNRLGIHKIQKLSFDENFYLQWSGKGVSIGKKVYFNDFTDAPAAKPQFLTREEIIDSLKKNFIPRAQEYKASLALAQKNSLAMLTKIKLQAPKSVEFIHSQNYSTTVMTRVYQTWGIPVYDQVKLMNLSSNNYIADYYFEFLGGKEKFDAFHEAVLISQKVVTPESFQIFNGSGYPIKVDDKKIYNQASCAEILAHMIDAQRVLQKFKLSLTDVMAVSGAEPSTLRHYQFSPGVVIAKTGSVDPAVNLAGVISTQIGTLYFGFLYRTGNGFEWSRARAQIQNQLIALITKNNGGKATDYINKNLFYFDSEAYLKPM